MKARLRYAAILLLVAPAIYVGLYPSLLTLGALIALLVAPIAAVGVVSPRVLAQSPRLRRAATVGGALIGLELVLLAAWIGWDRRRPVHLSIPEPGPGRYRIVYDVEDGAPKRALWSRSYEFAASSPRLLHSSYGPDEGAYDPANPHPATAFVRDTAGVGFAAPVRWVAGGVTRAAGCTFAYDEFWVGDTLDALGARAERDAMSPGWLDSLETWGVACGDGRLFRAPTGVVQSLKRSSPACYYQRSGAMVCGMASRAP